MIYISDLCVWLAINKVTTYRNRFYAENATVLATPDYFSEFVIQTVVPLLNGGYCKMPYAEIAKKLCFWVESFEGNVKMWTDAPHFDWPHIKQMFDTYGWPSNLVNKPTPIALSFPNSIQQTRFFAAVEDTHSILSNQNCDDIMPWMMPLQINTVSREPQRENIENPNPRHESSIIIERFTIADCHDLSIKGC